MKPLRLIGLTQNNLQHLSLEIEKNQLIVFTGVSGSGKSSLVFDTIAAEAQRQMNAITLHLYGIGCLSSSNRKQKGLRI